MPFGLISVIYDSNNVPFTVAYGEYLDLLGEKNQSNLISAAKNIFCLFDSVNLNKTTFYEEQGHWVFSLESRYNPKLVRDDKCTAK